MWRLALPVVLLLITSCGSVPLQQAQLASSRGDYQQAVKLLSDGDIRSEDRILALMEKGLALHRLSRYEESNEALLAALDRLDDTDSVSVIEQSTALAINDWTTTYRGEYAERLWLHTFLMMNFLLLNQLESAAVEARRAVAVYEDHGNVLQSDVFTRAVAALAFESARVPNSALVEYRKIAELLPSSDGVADKIFTLAKELALPEVADQYKTSARGRNKHENSGDYGELAVFVDSGQIPAKLSGDLLIDPDTRISFPFYSTSIDSEPAFTLSQQGRTLGFSKVTTALGPVATSSLQERGKRIAARQIGRVAVKKALVDELADDSTTGAAILNILLFATEVADTRAWDSLPAYLTLLRIELPEGTHTINISTDTGHHQSIEAVSITAGKTTFTRASL